jgi:hypothetical protein
LNGPCEAIPTAERRSVGEAHSFNPPAPQSAIVVRDSEGCEVLHGSPIPARVG